MRRSPLPARMPLVSGTARARARAIRPPLRADLIGQTRTSEVTDCASPRRHSGDV